MLSCPCFQHCVHIIRITNQQIRPTPPPLPQHAWLYIAHIQYLQTHNTHVRTHTHMHTNTRTICLIVRKCRSGGISCWNKLKHCEWWVYVFSVCSPAGASKLSLCVCVCLLCNVFMLSHREFILNLALIRLNLKAWNHAYTCLTHTCSHFVCVCVCVVGGSRMVLPTWGRAGEEEAS